MCASGKRHDEEKSNRYANFAPRKWWFISYRTLFNRWVVVYFISTGSLNGENASGNIDAPHVTKGTTTAGHLGWLSIPTILRHGPPTPQRQKKAITPH